MGFAIERGSPCFHVAEESGRTAAAKFGQEETVATSDPEDNTL